MELDGWLIVHSQSSWFNKLSSTEKASYCKLMESGQLVSSAVSSLEGAEIHAPMSSTLKSKLLITLEPNSTVHLETQEESAPTSGAVTSGSSASSSVKRRSMPSSIHASAISNPTQHLSRSHSSRRNRLKEPWNAVIRVKTGQKTLTLTAPNSSLQAQWGRALQRQIDHHRKSVSQIYDAIRSGREFYHALNEAGLANQMRTVPLPSCFSPASNHPEEEYNSRETVVSEHTVRVLHAGFLNFRRVNKKSTSWKRVWAEIQHSKDPVLAVYGSQVYCLVC